MKKIIFCLMMVFVSCSGPGWMDNRQKEQRQQEIGKVCWRWYYATIQSYQGFYAGASGPDYPYETTEPEYGIIQIEYMTKDPTIYRRGPRFFSPEMVKYWRDTVSAIPECK